MFINCKKESAVMIHHHVLYPLFGYEDNWDLAHCQASNII